MSKKANPTVIGVFIVAGLALGVAGLIALSSGNIFSKKQRYILYFQGSMKGLNKGAPVQLKGVTVGTVLDVYVAHNQAPADNSSPVIIEVDQAMMDKKTDRRMDIGSKEKIDELIAKGLRARLDAASFVTGVLMIQIEIMENASPPVFHQIKAEYMEVPTVPTTVQVLLANLSKIDVKGMADTLNSILTRFDTKLSDLDVKAINADVTNLLASLNHVVTSPELTNSLASLHTTLDSFGALAKHIDTNTLVQVQATLADLRLAVQGVSTMVSPDAPVQTELAGALEQLGNASRAVAELAEFLKRNPDALIYRSDTPKRQAMKSPSPLTRLLLASGLCVAAAGCFSPHTVATRHFLLAPAPHTGAAPATNVRLGVRVVGMPEYLLGNSLAVRQSAHEIRYLEAALWAERLDHGFERVLAADLSTMIPTREVRLGAWRNDDVTLEVHVRVEQFDVDKDGKGNLVAEWRITSAGGGKVLKSGTARLTRSGKPLAGDAQNIVTTLSELTADFSRALAQAVKEAQPE